MSDDSMIEEFKIEAQEMFENAETGLLNIERGDDFNVNYNSIFRSFHSLKGASGMFGLEILQSHMHKLESIFEAQKAIGGMGKSQIDYFLRGVDCARHILDGVDMKFNHLSYDDFKLLDSVNAPALAVSAKEEKLPPEKNNQTEVIKKVDEVEKSLKNGLASGKKEKIDRKNGVVFVIDDEEDIAALLSNILEKDGYQVFKYTDALEAIEDINEIRPDLITSDIKMPKLNGVEFSGRIRESYPEIPVILISSYIDKEIMLEALKNGVYGFIEKPFEIRMVLGACKNAIVKSQLQKLLNRSVDYILYQFTDLSNYLKEQGKESIRQSLKDELEKILILRAQIKKHDRTF